MNVVLAIGKGIEADVKDVDDFFKRLGNDLKNVASPRALLALAVLAGPLAQTVIDAAGAVSAGGLNIPLDVVTAEMLIELWPDLKAYLNTLSIQSTSQGVK